MSSPDGGFFAAPLPTASVGSYVPPAAQPTGWGGGPAVPAAPPAAGAVPIWVAAAATVLVLTGAAAGWLGLTLVVTVDAVGVGVDGEGVLVRALLLLLNAAANVVLAHQLLRGSEAARWLVSALCAWWALYWLWKTSQLSDLTGQLGATPFMGGLGQVGTMLTLGLLLLVSLAGATAGLLWTSAAGRHFTGR